MQCKLWEIWKWVSLTESETQVIIAGKIRIIRKSSNKTAKQIWNRCKSIREIDTE